MKRRKITIAALLAMAALLPLESCIGNFALTHKVLSWNQQIGDKWVNEIVFVCFCILPVYEISALADVLVINSIEFCSGKNPVTAQQRVVDGKDARYMVESDATGYTITNLSDRSVVRLNFDSMTRSWSVEHNGEETVFMTFIDDTHVRMAAPGGDFTTVELNEQGFTAYQQLATQSDLWATR